MSICTSYRRFRPQPVFTNDGMKRETRRHPQQASDNGIDQSIRLRALVRRLQLSLISPTRSHAQRESAASAPTGWRHETRFLISNSLPPACEPRNELSITALIKLNAQVRWNYDTASVVRRDVPYSCTSSMYSSSRGRTPPTGMGKGRLNFLR